MLLILSQQKLIGHSRDVIANNYMSWVSARQLFVWLRHRPRRSQVVAKKLLEAAHRTVAILGDLRPVVNIRKQEPLEFCIARSERIAEPRDTLRQPPEFLHGSDF